MKNYHITWEINISANSAREAADAARAIQQRTNSWATVFTVYDVECEETQNIDLLEDGEDCEYGKAE